MQASCLGSPLGVAWSASLGWMPLALQFQKEVCPHFLEKGLKFEMEEGRTPIPEEFGG